jgi:hypothetical protein
MNVILISLIAAAAAAVLVFILTGRKTSEDVKRQEMERSYIRSLSEYIRGAEASCNDVDLKKKIRHLADLSESSPHRSSPQVRDLEENAVEAAMGLAGAVSAGDSEEVLQALEETERLIRMRNQRLEM